MTCLSIIAIFGGYLARLQFFQYAGFVVMFLMASAFMWGGIQYENGETITLNGSTYTVTPTFTTYTDHWPAWLMLMTSIFGMIIINFSTRRE